MPDRNETSPGGPRFGREEALAVGVWLALTVLGELLVWRADPFPERFSNTAEISDDAFLVLTRLAVPVFAFVLSILIVSLLRFRSRGRPDRDGDGFAGSPAVYKAWLAITGGLAVLLIVHPGLTGIAELGNLRHEHIGEELEVQIEGARWAWTVTYPDAAVTTGDELVLPVDVPVHVEVTSVDILHSFWIPAFRTKIDAVPGLVTEAWLTPDRTGSFEDDPALRLQCAELCGLAHGRMAMPVRVVAPGEFEAWLAAQGAGGAPTCEPDGIDLVLVAKDVAFDTHCLAVPADTPFTITLDNQDPGIAHNVSIAADPGWNDVLFTGTIFPGVDSLTEEVPGLPAGTYSFRCDVHPIPAMSGTFVVAGEEG
jgi:cytochrome c oxidase subunit 2